MLYLIINIALTLWVIIDAKSRKANMLGWGIVTFLIPAFILPIYFAYRPLKPDEIREGGKAWNVLKNFSIVWTIIMLIILVLSFFNISTVMGNFHSDAEKAGAVFGTTIGFGLIGALWFFPVFGMLVLGLLLKKTNEVERGVIVSSPVPVIASEALPKIIQKPSTLKAIIVVSFIVVGLTLVTSFILGPFGASNQAVTSVNPSTVSTKQLIQDQTYSLHLGESAVLSFLLNDEITNLKKGFPTILFNNLQSVTAVEVVKAYEDNQVAADQKYFEKKLSVKGVIESINSGLGNKPYIALRGINPFLLPQVHFKNPDVEKIAALNKGQSLNVICDGGGSIASMPMFKNCLFLDDYANQVVSKMKQGVEDYLAGKHQEDSTVAFTVLGLAMIRTLPNNSPCFTDINTCTQELETAFSKKPNLKYEATSVIEELKKHGIQVPDTVIEKIASMNDPVTNNVSE